MVTVESYEGKPIGVSLPDQVTLASPKPIRS